MNENTVKNSEIIFLVEESQDGGYEAKGLGYSIYTQGESRNELIINIKDALKCHFDDEKEIPHKINSVPQSGFATNSLFP